MATFPVLIYASGRPRKAWRLAQRIEQEVSAARICGLIYEPPSPDTGVKRLDPSIGRSRSPRIARYALTKMGALLRNAGRRIADTLLRLAHACPANPNGRPQFTVQDLVDQSRALGWPILVCGEGDARAAQDFVEQQGPDLGIALDQRRLSLKLLTLPRYGWISIRRCGLQEHEAIANRVEPLASHQEISVLVYRVADDSDSGAVLCADAIPINPYDTPTSLTLKANLIGNDLLVQTATSLAKRTVLEQLGESFSQSRLPVPQRAARQEGEVQSLQGQRPPLRTRPLWKMCLSALLLSPYLIVRNWLRRWRGGFPVVILFHHLVSDRPHQLGIPTEVFLRQIEFLRHHYRILSLPQAIKLLESNAVKVPSVVLTFDDGYGENFVNLRAVVEETGVPVSLFVCTQLVEEQREFPHDQARGQTGFLPLTWDQIACFRASGVEIGSHTRTHFDCGSTDLSVLQKEIVGSKEDLERLLGRPVRFFSFPWGKPENMSAQAVALARSIYPYLLSASGGENFPDVTGAAWHLRRKFLPADLWELELSLQSVFDLTGTLKKVIGLGIEPSSQAYDLG